MKREVFTPISMTRASPLALPAGGFFVGREECGQATRIKRVRRAQSAGRASASNLKL